MRKASRGLFIVLEGPEGSGKSLQAQWLAEELRARGHAVALTREPGGTALGERVRMLLLEGVAGTLAPRTEALLFSASRAQLLAEVIAPRLSAGDIVICDRFSDSTLAYQGYGRGLPLEELEKLIAFTTGGIWPDLTLYLDLPVEVGLDRRRKEGSSLNRLDREGLAFHRRVREGYLALARRGGNRGVIDALDTPEEMRKAIWKAVEERLTSIGEMKEEGKPS